MDYIKYRPIGIIHSPFKRLEGTPIQAVAGSGQRAEVEILPEFVAGLQDLDGFSHIMLFYHCHQAQPYRPLIKPFLDDAERGLFATRSPARPNPIGFSTVRLIRIEKQILYVEDIDIIDRTPLLDIKPLVPEFDTRKVDRIGWLEKKVANVKKKVDDGRFGSQ
ncbi:MAG: tRNA (N6-threonylcarbamoyladenosine(37)-N6)-methyltransferase TrmO [Deltaproteobacteria bacterium]|nr:tRNA (N6-threonylcarbamoyladenosine(37)-N6)-methyltransferase TrmO [Deltaproteobacteria bacterium]